MSHDQTEAEPLGDICMSCGKKHPSQLWGATCSCRTPKMVVHLHKCNGCARVMGQRTDDDYCGPELLFCPDCVSAASKRGEEERLPRRRDDPSGAESAHASAVVALAAEPLRDRCRMKDMTCSSTAIHVACVVCGAVGHAGTGMWAVFHDGDSRDRDDPHVCTGVCYRLYRARLAAAKTPQTIDEMLRDALAEAGAILADAKLSPAERVTKTNTAWSATLRKIIDIARADLVVEVEHLTKSLKRANEKAQP